MARIIPMSQSAFCYALPCYIRTMENMQKEAVTIDEMSQFFVKHKSLEELTELFGDKVGSFIMKRPDGFLTGIHLLHCDKCLDKIFDFFLPHILKTYKSQFESSPPADQGLDDSATSN